MPGYVSGQSKKFNKAKGKWENVKNEQAFDYDNIDAKSWALLISFFRFYPDYFLDMIRADDAPYGLELPQRMMLRIQARYQTTYITGARGITKTFITVASKMHDGEFYPGERTRYYAPAQKQAAQLASQAFETISHCYPLLASLWNKKNDREAMFKLDTDYGSEFSMYAPRGDNFHSVIAEEMAQSGDDGFNFTKFSEDVQKGHRLERMVNKQRDRTRVQLKFNCISNASSRQSPAFHTYRAAALKAMITGDEYDGYCIDIPWEVALLFNLRSIDYYKKERATTTHDAWLREMCALYVGSDDDPMVSDTVLARACTLKYAEFEHCGDPNAIYVVAHDVSYADGRQNAKCADAVVKLTPYRSESKRDKYRKQVVFVDNYPPPATAFLQAEKLKKLWLKYCKDGCQATYLLVDAQAYGTEVIEELMKPATDGTPTLCCVKNMGVKFSDDFSRIEQQGALPVIFPMKSGPAGSANPEGDMITYAQAEFEQGNVELLISNALDGVEAYKRRHNIKDNDADGTLAAPYKQTELLKQQISNLRTKVSGTALREVRKSKYIQRDIWSALKYALRVAQLLEAGLKNAKYKAESTWTAAIESYKVPQVAPRNATGNDTVSRLLALRKR